MEAIIEKIPVSVYGNANEGSVVVAKEIANFIRRHDAENKKTVLGLATGSSPIKVYQELVRLHKEENLSFKNVITFNLDEYYPMSPEHPESYVNFMHKHLFDHVDIPRENIHIPNGQVERERADCYCSNYEYAIDEAGGIDIQILGIGRSGHIGFNEPGSPIYSKTRLTHLDRITRKDAAASFDGIENVPQQAITMGISTIMKARKIFLLAWGAHKASIIKQAVEGEIRDYVPATFLQEHNNVNFILDTAAAQHLTRVTLPWLFSECDWTNLRLARKAVIWLSLTLNKSILKLTNKDYIDNHLSSLLNVYKTSYELNINIFNELQHTITGWPGGKPLADDSQRPERAKPFPKRVVVFSPHPDDDVISMGGTFARLVKHGHEVHVAYQTSGHHAVFDDDLIKYLEFMVDVKDIVGINAQVLQTMTRHVDCFRAKKTPDTRVLELFKTYIRRGEARASTRYIGVPNQRVHFLDMPFYDKQTKLNKSNNDLSKEDIQLIIDLLQEIKPHQIYAAGDFNDPHGTHKICFHAIIEACLQLRHEPWMKDCYIWLYRGAWDEWKIYEADMAVPLSPDEVSVKRMAIFKHQTQKDSVVYPGTDSREFWQRAEDRNHHTAVLYDTLGLADYQAIELFVRYRL